MLIYKPCPSCGGTDKGCTTCGGSGYVLGEPDTWGPHQPPLPPTGPPLDHHAETSLAVLLTAAFLYLLYNDGASMAWQWWALTPVTTLVALTFLLIYLKPLTRLLIFMLKGAVLLAFIYLVATVLNVVGGARR